jgi:hypothetical protein
VAPSLRLPASEQGNDSLSFQLDDGDDDDVIDHNSPSSSSHPFVNKRLKQKQLATLTSMLHDLLNSCVDVALAIDLQRASPLLVAALALQASPLMEAFGHKAKAVLVSN